MKVDKGVSTWRIWGFYIQCLKELTFAKSKSTGNNCPHTTIANIYIFIYICICICKYITVMQLCYVLF